MKQWPIISFIEVSKHIFFSKVVGLFQILSEFKFFFAHKLIIISLFFNLTYIFKYVEKSKPFSDTKVCENI